MSHRSRLLGLAFVASDFLMEIDETRTVRFAAGAAAVPGADAAPAYEGRPLDEILSRASAWEFRRVLADAAPGRRLGPIDVLVRCGDGMVRKAVVRGFCAPQLAPSVSLGLCWEGSPFALHAPPLATSTDFLNRTRTAMRQASEPMAVSFVEVAGLSVPPTSQVMDVVASTLQEASIDGSSAAQLSEDRFAVLRSQGDTRDLADLLREACAAENVSIAPVVEQGQLGSDPLAALRALRYAIAECIAEGPAESARNFSSRVAQTLRDAAEFRRIAREQAFEVHFQPIVSLESGAVHHHEVLARFASGDTGELIRMAEELDLIRSFDLAVLAKALRALRQPGAGLAKLAVNVSGASLATDDFVLALLRRTSAEPDDRRRLMVEVTETSALEDLPAARRRLERLRDAGVKVCIDDFGAGAASFEYLRALSIDMVKLDGCLTRAILTDERSRTMVAHIVDLCRTLGVRTVAEQVETEDIAQALRSLGVDMAQGWRYGRPTPELVTRLPETLPTRRKGAISAWA
ncbi:EAL domain-containing protein [Brevundimonas sp.]|uniref:EAL domain-containing protein n=1 Tax=Brevundimonas sp. TaxID=1871086 RepID=UPI0025D79D04|nr:EAL domain-containing protein [Brevundimonas sp.]